MGTEVKGQWEQQHSADTRRVCVRPKCSGIPCDTGKGVRQVKRPCVRRLAIAHGGGQGTAEMYRNLKYKQRQSRRVGPV